MALFSGVESVVNLSSLMLPPNVTLAKAAKGGWIAAYEAPEGGTDGLGIFLRIFDADGNAGPEIHVNQKTSANQGEISVTMLSDGGFIVTWTDKDAGAADEWDIYQRRYDQSGVPVTGDMKVNTTGIMYQYTPDVTAMPDGGWIVTWTSDGQAGPWSDVFMRRFDAAGAAVSGEVLVNSTTTEYSYGSTTTTLLSGGFVVTWHRQTATDIEIYQRHFDSSGIALGPESVVDAVPGGMEDSPQTISLEDGGWVIVWASFGADGSGWGICQRRFDAGGNPVATAPYIVNSHTADAQQKPAAASLPDGGWVIVWQSENQDDNNPAAPYGIYQQVYDATGNPVGPETLVNDQVAGSQSRPSITVLDDGSWVVAWQDDSSGNIEIVQKKFEPIHEGTDASVNLTLTAYQTEPTIVARPGGGWVAIWQSDEGALSGNANDGMGVFMRYFDANGVGGPEIHVNQTIEFNQFEISATCLANGDVIVTWTDENSLGASEWDVHQRRFDSNGNPLGAETLVHTTTALYQYGSTATALPDGGWLVAWSSDGQASPWSDIFFRRFDADGVGLSGEVVVNTTTAFNTYNYSPSITVLSDGGWVASWMRENGGSREIFQNRFDKFGNQVGAGEAKVDIVTGEMEDLPQTIALADGGWVVVYQGWDTSNSGKYDGDGWGVFQTRYDSGGNVVGNAGEQVNMFTAGAQKNASAAALLDGGWVVVWESFLQDGSSGGIYQRVYDGDGNPVSDDVLVNDEVMGDQTNPSVTVLENGNWVVSWQSNWDAASGTMQDFEIVQKTFDRTHVAPEGEDKTITLIPADTHAFSAGDFVIKDRDGHKLHAVEIVDYTGTLTWDGVVVGKGALIGVSDISKLEWTSNGAVNGSTTGTVSFKVIDKGNTLYGGSNVDAVANTITFANTPATFGGSLSAAASEDETGAIGGTATVSDADSGEGAFQAVAAADLIGAFGTFSFDAATGAWSYDLDEAAADVQSLKSGDALTDTLTLTSTDGTTADVKITLGGVNDAAVFGGDLATGIFEDESTVIGGTATVSDVDSGQSAFLAVQAGALVGTHGIFSFDELTGEWTYDLNEGSATIQALKSGESVTDKLTLASVDGTTKDIAVTINGANDSAVFSGNFAKTINEDDTSISGGSVTVSDADSGESSFLPVAAGDLTGSLGTFTFTAFSGIWTFDLDETSPAVQSLKAGQSAMQSLVISSADGTTKTIGVTVQGVNDPAVFSGDLAKAVSEDETAILNGAATINDLDANEGGFLPVQPGALVGAHGTFTFNAANGEWSYDLDEASATVQALKAGESLTDTLTLSSVDGTTKDIVVTINGVNDAAILAGNLAASVLEDEAAVIGGTATVTDPDAGESVFAAAAAADLIGAFGTFTFDEATGQWSYDLDQANADVQALKAGESLTDTLSVASADGTTKDIVVTIDGVNDSAVIAGDLAAGISEDETAIVGGTASVSDADTAEAAFAAAAAADLIGAFGTFSFDEATGQWSYDLDEASAGVQGMAAGGVLTDTLSVATVDGTTKDIVVTINGVNDAAILAGDLAAGLSEDEAAIVGGTATVADPDAGESVFAAATAADLVGAFGTFTFDEATGQWSYDLDQANADVQALKAGESLTDTLSVASADGTTEEIVVTINGGGDGAMASGDLTGTTGEDDAGTVAGTIVIADPDAGENQIVAVKSGLHGAFSINVLSGQWSYDLDNADSAVQSLGQGETLADVMQLATVDGTVIDITITINGVNDAAVTGGLASATVVEDSILNASGLLTIADPDKGQSGWQQPASLAGAFGTFVFDGATGAWSYALDNANAAVQALKAGESLAETLTVTSFDGSAQNEIVVTIEGADEAPTAAVISGNLAAAITEDEAAIASGTISVSDPDAGENGFALPALLAGAHGIFAFDEATGQWSYDLDETAAAVQAMKPGEILTDTLQVASLDGTAAEIVVTINGANDAAVISGDVAMGITEDEAGLTGGTLTVSDADAGEGIFLAPLPGALAGAHGVFSFNEADGQWSYDLDEADADVQGLKAGQALTDTLSVLSADGAAAVITVTIAGANDAPVVAPALADLAAAAGNPFLFDAGSHFADADGDALTFTATRVDGSLLPAWLDFDPATGTFSGTPADSDAGPFSIAISATDGQSGIASDVFTLTVSPTPVANRSPFVATSLADQSASEDSAFNFTIPAGSFMDLDGDNLQLSAMLADGSALPAWLTFDAASRTFSGTPQNSDVGTLAIIVTASDGTAAALDVFTLEVGNTNDAPTLAKAIADQNGARNAAFSFILPADTFADIDAGDSLSLSAMLENGDPLPAWLAFDPLTASFSGTPGVGDAKSYAIRITATDTAGAAASGIFNLVIADINDAPGGTDGTIVFDEETSHVFAAADFGFADANGHGFASVILGEFTGRGTLSFKGEAVTAGQEIAVAELSELVLTSGKDEVGDQYATLAFQVRDDGGTDKGGVDLDPEANMLTFAVTDLVDIFTGTRRKDRLIATEGGDILKGLGRNDVLTGLDGKDTMLGGKGSDRLVGGNGDDRLLGGAGNDRHTGAEGNDFLLAGVGNDILSGGNGDDILNGGKGADRLNGGAGNDTFIFRKGYGHDTIIGFDAVTPDQDVIDLLPLRAIRNFEDLMAHHVEVVGKDIVIKAGADELLLKNVRLADLTADDFLI